MLARIITRATPGETQRERCRTSPDGAMNGVL